MNTAKNRIITVMGPTASGKSALAIRLAKAHNGAVISVDSRQIYLGMDIGTGKEGVRPGNKLIKVTEDLWQRPYEIQGVDHYLLDIIKPDEEYTAFDFKKQCEILCEHLWQEGKVPILAGGTGLYFSTFLFDYQPGAATTDHQIKTELEQRLKEPDGKQKLWQELYEVDPESAENIHYNNTRYVIRALEYYKATGEPKSAGIGQLTEPRFPTLMLGIDWPREELYDRIEKRIDLQMDQGLLEETKKLLAEYDNGLPSLSSLGYQELGQYLAGDLLYEEALAQFKQHTRQYAKRQLTWFRRYSDLHWIDKTTAQDPSFPYEDFITQFLQIKSS